MVHLPHYDVYQEQLADLYMGYALWQPAPGGLYDQVRVGDVGFIFHGHFNRVFNAILPATHPAQGYDLPHDFEPLNMGHFGNIRTLNLPHGDYCSPTVTKITDDIGEQIQAASPDEVPNASFRCRRGKGAFLSLPFDAHREDVIRTKVFEAYMIKHCASWLELAITRGFDVKLEDIIFVTGCDLTSSWAMATFMNPPWDAEMSLSVQPVGRASARFQWAAPSQPHNNESTQNSSPTHCVFIRGFRAKRGLFGIRLIGENGYRSNSLRNSLSSLGDDSRIESSSSLDTIRPPISLPSLGSSPSNLSLDTIGPPENQRSIWRDMLINSGLRNAPSVAQLGLSTGNRRSIWSDIVLRNSGTSSFLGSSSSLDTIGPSINPQLLPYPSATTLQSNGSVYNASFMTTAPSYNSLIEVLNDIAEIRDEDAFAEDATSITDGNDLSDR